MSIVVVTGTGTDIGKTVATAALAAAYVARGPHVGVCKPVQTGCAPGDPGDTATIAQLAGLQADQVAELYRYPEPLAPETAARRAGLPPPKREELAAQLCAFAAGRDITVVEGAGGVLVRLAPGLTIVDVARDLQQCSGQPVEALVVTRAGLGTLSDTELAVDRVRAAGVAVGGIVIGALPDVPDVAVQCNLDDLPRLTGIALVGAIPAGAGTLAPAEFAARAGQWLSGEYLDRVCASERLR